MNVFVNDEGEREKVFHLSSFLFPLLCCTFRMLDWFYIIDLRMYTKQSALFISFDSSRV